MDKYFKTIASICLQHEYYTNKALTVATLHALPETALFFKNHRIMFKRKKDLYVLLQEAAVGTSEVTITFEPARLLFFGIQFNDRHYQLRSGLNFDPRGAKIAVETGEADHYTVSEKDILPLRNSLPGATDEPVVVTRKNGEIVFSTENDTGIRFSDLETGIYETNGGAFLKCADASAFDAVLIITLAHTEPATKTITIPSGAYRWRYLVQKKYTQPAALSLVDDNEKINFKPADSAKEDISVFLSESPVPLSELLTTSLALYNNDLLVKKFLPVPDLQNARFFSTEEKTLVLEAYVTI